MTNIFTSISEDKKRANLSTVYFLNKKLIIVGDTCEMSFINK